MCMRANFLPLCPTLCDLWTVVCHTPLSMGFSRQEYWSGLPCPPPGDLPDPGIEPSFPPSPALQVDSLPLSLGNPGLHYMLWQRIRHVWAQQNNKVFIKVKNLFSRKDFKRMRRLERNWKKIFVKDTYDKGLFPKYSIWKSLKIHQ